ncbi:MAG: Y-family DNA polymerase [Weeksellaceae bacterium]
MFAVIDCNNFYVSCERIFDPSLINKPVVVLSNNDGCIISRSNEIKQLGLRIGDPLFKHKDQLLAHGAHIFSANFHLYGDLSGRVMQIIARFAPQMELYSIDEAFVYFDGWSLERIEAQCRTIRAAILQEIGMPVSIGVATTKTLAKAANEYAKDHEHTGGVKVFDPADWQTIDKALFDMPVGHVWGVGWKTSVKLQEQNIFNALQLKSSNLAWIRQQMSITGMRTVIELNGKSCIGLTEHHDPKKAIISSRTFGRTITSLVELQEAVATFAARASEKLRDEAEVAASVTVSVITNRHRAQDMQYWNSATVTLGENNDYTPSIIAAADRALKQIYKKGYRYKKASVVLSGLTSKTTVQEHLFEKELPLEKREKLMKAIDSMNSGWGREIMRFGRQGTKQAWRWQDAYRSKRYTTRWDELRVVKAT